MRNLVFLCTVWFVLGSGNVIGQDQSQVDTSPVDVTSDETSPIEIDESESAGDMTVVEEAVDNNSVDSPDSESAESTGRFIPTEQISQDLGVSFPANI